MRFVLLAVFVFLYAPLVALIAFSFNDSKRNIVWRGFTTKYYEKAAVNEVLVEAFVNSLLIAFFTAAVTTFLGAAAAWLLWRYRFPFKWVCEGSVALPIVIPEICMGVAMLVFFSRIGWPDDLPWPLNLSRIGIAHVSFAFPFVAVVVRARLASFNRELEEAAHDLDRPGYVYVLPSDSFEQVDPWQWASSEPVKPVDVIRIDPNEYAHWIRDKRPGGP